jgi:hypothetical protein
VEAPRAISIRSDQISFSSSSLIAASSDRWPVPLPDPIQFRQKKRKKKTRSLASAGGQTLSVPWRIPRSRICAAAWDRIVVHLLWQPGALLPGPAHLQRSAAKSHRPAARAPGPIEASPRPWSLRSPSLLRWRAHATPDGLCGPAPGRSPSFAARKSTVRGSILGTASLFSAVIVCCTCIFRLWRSKMFYPIGFRKKRKGTLSNFSILV